MAAADWRPVVTVDDEWEQLVEEVQIDVLVCTLVSLVSSMLLCLLYWLLPRVRRMPGWVMFRSTLCDLVVSIGFLLLYSLEVNENNVHCTSEVSAASSALVLFLVGAEVGANLWRVVMYFHLVSVYLNPFNPERYRHLYPLLVTCVGLSAVAGSGVLLVAMPLNMGSGPVGMSLCGRAYLLVLFLGFVVIPSASFIVGGAMNIAVRVMIKGALKEARRSGHPASISFLARQRVMRHGTAYLLLYGTQLSASFVACALLHNAPGKYANLLWPLIVVLICGRPAISFAGWLVINDIVYIVFGVCSFFKPNTHPSSRRVTLLGASSANARRPLVAGEGGLSNIALSGSPRMRSSAAIAGSPQFGPSVSPTLAPTSVISSSAAAAAILPPLAVVPGVDAAAPSGRRSQSRQDQDFYESGRRSDVRSFVSTLLSPGELTGYLATARDSMERRAVLVQGIEEVGFKEELRFELLYDVALGIGELAQRELLQISPRGGGSPNVAPSISFDLDAGANVWSRPGPPAATVSGATGSALQSGSVVSMVSAASQGGTPGDAAPPASVRGASASGVRAMRSPGAGPAPAFRISGAPLSGLPRLQAKASEVCTLMDADLNRPRLRRSMSGGAPLVDRSRTSRAHHYAVDDFRAVRESFGISSAAYARAFPNDLSELDPNWVQRLKESVSEGASGSFFYRVFSGVSGREATSRFIIKQITLQEKRTLMRLLPAYRSHVQRRSGRSLIQYFGCHSMSLSWRYSGKVYFVVMRNFLPVKQWLTFDLKGATANRRALSARFLHRIHAGADPRGGAAYGTLRDWEWMDIAMTVDISAQDRASLAEIVAADAAFLREQGMLDYSLLVGIHRLPRDLAPAEHEARLQQLIAAGGYVSLERQKVYFFGIIDVLESYSLRWQMQHAVLRTAYCLSCKCASMDGISALPPHEYADRFQTFVSREVLHIGPSTAYGIGSRPSGASADLDESWRQQHRCWCCCRPSTISGTFENDSRWTPLWERRRRGLVRERIEADRADHMRRISELEGQL
eukprot:TRINITY_DN21170_c0_g1_i1.p1 TRINITY_DN21170_c0_g1~~TRINITY_DN21170_c0_g1_i1.p1  ORF type:complete len:1067 (+),score=206.70 TRINITY_DN21170_c0_g1_i1:123-3203(+)